MAADEIDSSKLYKSQEKGEFFDDGREGELLEYILEHESQSSVRGSPQKVLELIDEYARTKKFLMNVGPFKGKIVCDVVAREKPETMVELGGYCGYSAVMFGDAVKQAGGKRYLSLERNAEFAKIVAAVVELAGLDDIVEVVVGPADESLRRLHATNTLKRIDVLFLDHYKPAYTSDLKLCESLGLVGPGSVLVADNCMRPGNPPYLEYVRSSVDEKRLQSRRVPSDDKTRFSERFSNMYKKRIAEEHLSDANGNPNLVYESEMIQAIEPNGDLDGIEVTKCVGEEQL